MAEKEKYCVYRHTFPNGKVYIGMTGGKPEDRWDNGMGYQTNKKMFHDIVLYGWRNIAHEIIKDGLCKAEATALERKLTQEYGKKGREKTYNIQNADYEVVRTEWYNLEINSETIKKYGNDFEKLYDDWIGLYSQSGMMWSCRATEYGIILELPPYKEDGVFLRKILLFEYPVPGMTFLEVNSWLFEKPEPIVLVWDLAKTAEELIEAQHEPILKDGE